MSNERKKILILLGLISIMFVTWVLVLRKPSSPEPRREVERMDGLVSQNNIDKIVDILMTEMKTRQVLLNLKTLQSKNLSFSSLRNPFQKPSTKDKEIKKLVRRRIEEVSKPRIVVKGIMWDEQNPAAIINDEVVYEGTFISGYKIIKIEPDRVIVNYNGKKHVLNVPGE